MPCTWTGRPSGQAPKFVGSANASYSSAAPTPGRFWASCWAAITPSEMPPTTRSSGEAVGRGDAPGADVGEPDGLDVRRALLDGVEGAPLEEVRRVDGVAGGPEGVGERDDPGREALDVVEEEEFSHVGRLGGVADGRRPASRWGGATRHLPDRPGPPDDGGDPGPARHHRRPARRAARGHLPGGAPLRRHPAAGRDPGRVRARPRRRVPARARDPAAPARLQRSGGARARHGRPRRPPRHRRSGRPGGPGGRGGGEAAPGDAAARGGTGGCRAAHRRHRAGSWCRPPGPGDHGGARPGAAGGPAGPAVLPLGGRARVHHRGGAVGRRRPARPVVPPVPVRRVRVGADVPRRPRPRRGAARGHVPRPRTTSTPSTRWRSTSPRAGSTAPRCSSTLPWTAVSLAAAHAWAARAGRRVDDPAGRHDEQPPRVRRGPRPDPGAVPVSSRVRSCARRSRRSPTRLAEAVRSVGPAS